MERIAIVADIHANLYALQAFLRYLDQEYPAARILNAGDFLQIGPHPREVAEIVLGDSRFVSVLGNNESSLLNPRPGAFDAGALAHQQWVLQQLGPELVQCVEALPRSRRLTIGDKAALLLHARLSDVGGRPLLYEPGRSAADFAADYAAEGADWVCFGHMHVPLYLVWEGQVFVNPGSLGCSKEGRVSFCLAELGEDSTRLAFQSLPYDRSSLRADYAARQVPEGEYLLRQFHGLEP